MYKKNVELAVGLEKLSKNLAKLILNRFGEFPNFSLTYYLITFLLLRDASYPILISLFGGC